ncbi:MAG TPA: bifunctional riboflavin kinase/FAD synthetase [Bacteroidales bacterium]|jgi:riboflavin kinase/FMN adenylyltransferase|nr:bifunctional riboflavin kinase/FAD synthetase [Bacteroidales bacterium]
MEIHRGHRKLNLTGSVVTVGVFDGVHKGHRALIDNVINASRQENGPSVVVTFKQHPRNVLGPASLQLLTTIEEKISLIEDLGVEHMIILDFNHEFSSTSACDFVRKVLKDQVGARHLVFGYDHRIGKDGEGDFNTIKNCTGLDGMIVTQSDGVFEGSRPVSSSMIRNALLEGDIDHANSLLAYNYTLSGEVMAGRKLGRVLGFPTANIKPGDSHKLIPGNGVYAVEVIADEARYMGMLSIGTNPTINPGNRQRSIEVHILDFDKDIYGQKLTVIFRKRLRDEKKFSDMQQLADQMEADRLETIRQLDKF